MHVAAIGECMVELASAGDGTYRLGFGGDTLNTATYLARLGVTTGYITALGDDPYSQAMLERWREEGIVTDHVKRVPGRVPGLYLIERDTQGERSFHYWRDQAPARALMDLLDVPMEQALRGCAWVYFSGITLSLYGEAGRARLIALLKRLKAAGVRLAFDGNYRPRGWASPDAARDAFEAILPMIDLALPTFEDEQAVFGDADAEACAARLMGMGAGEVVIKQGASGALVARGAERHKVPVPRAITPVDTTAAGDSFNAGYLAGRLRGLGLEASARAGHALAGAVILHRGAILPKETMPVFRPAEGQA